MPVETPQTYTILVHNDLETFERGVRMYIAQGWRPAGGVAVTMYEDEDHGYHARHWHYYQAMTKEETDERAPELETVRRWLDDSLVYGPAPWDPGAAAAVDLYKSADKLREHVEQWLSFGAA